MTESLHRSVYRLGTTDVSASLHRSYGRTDGRTNGDQWLSTRDHLTFSDAHARIRISPVLDSARDRADAELGGA